MNSSVVKILIHCVWIILVGLAIQLYFMKGLEVVEYNASGLATKIEITESKTPPVFKKKK